MFSYLRRDRYHCPIIMINIVRTKGKAGYLDWKFAGGQGDQDINLPCDWLLEITFFDLKSLGVLSANPLLILIYKMVMITKIKRKSVKIAYKYLLLRL